jgi:hypothetical protein
MSAKKTVKKKTAAKKAAKVMADVMNSIIETVAVEPMTTSSPHEMEVFDEDDYNPYAPGNVGGGWGKESTAFSSLDDEDPYPEPDAIIMPPDEPEPQPVPVEAPSSPSPAPAGRVVAAPVAPSPTPPPNEPTGDALIIHRLINGINHLYKIACLTKGAKGPQPEHVARIQTNILAAKDLITRLS